MATESRGTIPDPDEPIPLEAIESVLRCPRQYQYDHRQTIRTRTTRDASERRTALYRDVLTAALDRCSGPDNLRDAAAAILQDRLEAGGPGDGVTAAHHRQYDEASVRNAVENYVAEHGETHAADAIAIDETYTYSTDGVTVACPVDCLRSDDGGYEIIRFVTTLSGVVWENPYSDPVSD